MQKTYYRLDKKSSIFYQQWCCIYGIFKKHDLFIIYLSLKVVCAMHVLYKTGIFCLRVADPDFIYDPICVCTIRTHMCLILPGDLSLFLESSIESLSHTYFSTIISGGDM